jgi:hypothetical protein
MRHFHKKSRRVQFDKWPSTVVSRPTISRARARKGICGRSPSRAGHKIVAVFKETASGADNVRPKRAKDPGVARAHQIDAILVTELSRRGHDRRSPRLESWCLAQTGLNFDPSTASGKLMRTHYSRPGRIRSHAWQRLESGASNPAASWANTLQTRRPSGARHAWRQAVLSAHCPQHRMGKTTVMEIVRRGVGR